MAGVYVLCALSGAELGEEEELAACARREEEEDEEDLLLLINKTQNVKMVLKWRQHPSTGLTLWHRSRCWGKSRNPGNVINQSEKT